MQYYKSSELAEQYGVSRRTVTNWIEQTQQGRLKLELIKNGENFYIANTPMNQLQIKDLVTARRKFLNSKSLKKVTPTSDFYKLYTEGQILDIITSIDTSHEIPRQYNYFGNGADYWDQHVLQLSVEKDPSLPTISPYLIKINQDYIDHLLERHTHVNVIDAGVGNALPTKELLTHLKATGKLNRYVAIDISTRMLEIAKNNVKEWFGDTVACECYQRDFSFERFGDIIAEPPTAGDKSTVNLVLLLGGTLSNFTQPDAVLRVMRKSMHRDDLFLCTTILNSPGQRSSFTSSGTSNEQLPPQYKFIVDRLGILPEFYTVERGFDHEESCRKIQIRLKHAISIEFNIKKELWRVDLNKGDVLVLLRVWLETVSGYVAQLQHSGFSPMLISETPDHKYALLLSDLRVGDQ